MKHNKFLQLTFDYAIKAIFIVSLSYLGAEIIDCTVPEKYENKVFPSAQKYRDLQEKVDDSMAFLRYYEAPQLNVKTRDTSFLSNFLFNRKDIHAFSLLNYHYINFPLQSLSEEINDAFLLKEHLNLFTTDKDKEMVRYINKTKSQKLLFNLFLDLNQQEGIDFYFFHEASHILGHKLVAQYVVDNNLTDKYSASKLSSLEEAFCDVQAAIFVIKKNNLDKNEAKKFIQKLLSYRYSSKSIIYNMIEKETTHDSTYALYAFLNNLDKYWDNIQQFNLEGVREIAFGIAQGNFAPESVFEQENVEEGILKISLENSFIYQLKSLPNKDTLLRHKVKKH